jgi:ribokinase
MEQLLPEEPQPIPVVEGLKLPLKTIVGSLNIDLVARVPHHPLPGETLTSSSFAVSPGGKGANQAVACAKLSRARPGKPNTGDLRIDEGEQPGAEVRMVGHVGNDTYGSLLQRNLIEHDVGVEGLTPHDDLKTGIAIIIVDEPTGENRIVLSPEANHYMPPATELKQEIQRYVVGPKPNLIILQLEIPLEKVVALKRAAFEAKIPVLLNPAPALRSLPEEIYNGLDHLIMNEVEAILLSPLEFDSSHLETVEGLSQLAQAFIDKGVSHVVITLGARGAFYKAGGLSAAEALVAAPKATVIDTTAAGDTFVGAYAINFVRAKRFNMRNAISMATRAAAKTVEKEGAQDSIPWRDEAWPSSAKSSSSP